MCSISYKFVKTCFRYLLEVFNMPQGEGNGTPLQYCCLENRMDGGAWYAAVHGVARSRTWLSDFTFTFYFHALEKEMATHSSVLAWRIPWTEKPGRLQSMGSHRVGHDWSDLAAAAAATCLNSVQSLSRVQLFATPWIAALQAFLSITNSLSLLKLMSIKSVMPSRHLILCRPLLLLPPIPPSFRVFSNESTLHMRWPKYWSFSFSVSPSNEHPGLISFKMDWLDLLAVQGTLKSLLQLHSWKASILRHSAFFTVQLSHPYMTTGKTIALTKWTFVGKVMSLLFNMLSRLVITFLPKSKHLLISWLQSPPAMILELPKNSLTLFPHLFSMKWWDQMPWS